MRARSLSSGLAVVALTAAGCGGGGAPASEKRSDEPRAVAPPAPTVVTTASGAPERIPAPARRLTLVPAPGTVKLAGGPFNDRLRIAHLKLRRGDHPEVSGRMLMTADVSEVLALTVDVAFYDHVGRLVATGRRSLSDIEEFYDAPLRFRVRASKPAPSAVAGIVTVPEYVPE